MNDQYMALSINTEATPTTGKMLYLLADGVCSRIPGPGDALAGRTVADVAISTHAMDEGRIAMSVNFTNFTGGVFVYALERFGEPDARVIFFQWVRVALKSLPSAEAAADWVHSDSSATGSSRARGLPPNGNFGIVSSSWK